MLQSIMLGILADPASFASLPLGELIGVLTFVAALGMILVRHGLRPPSRLATSDEVARLQEKITDLQKQVVDLENDVRGWRGECVTTKELNGVSGRMNLMEASYLAVSDRAADAQHRAELAQTGVAALRDDIAKLSRLVERIPAQIGRLEGRMGVRDEHEGG
jgi:chromosome segregation ATPase